MFKGLESQRLTALFAIAVALLNFPLLVLWDRDSTVWNVPLFPAALFVIWALLIVALALIVERIDDDLPQGPTH